MSDLKTEGAALPPLRDSYETLRELLTDLSAWGATMRQIEFYTPVTGTLAKKRVLRPLNGQTCSDFLTLREKVEWFALGVPAELSQVMRDGNHHLEILFYAPLYSHGPSTLLLTADLPLRMWTNDTEFAIARTSQEAGVLSEIEEGFGEWYAFAPDRPVTVLMPVNERPCLSCLGRKEPFCSFCDGAGVVRDPQPDGAEDELGEWYGEPHYRVTKTAAEWIASEGPCLLFSFEY